LIVSGLFYNLGDNTLAIRRQIEEVSEESWFVSAGVA
jgi:hypothetical protein